jgi:upstream activation factor subunit UAF30
VKANGLQDEKDKRFIIIDDKLRPIFPTKKRVHMFSMNKELTKHFGEKARDDDGEDDEEVEDDASGSDEDSSKRSAPSKAKAPAAKKRKSGGGGGGGFAALVGLSPELGDLLGATELPRTQVVKGLWAYIKEHNLQNPDNRMQIIPDGKMKRVFGPDRFTGFSMMKLLTPHLIKK